MGKIKRLNSDNTAPRSAHLKNNYFTSIWHKSCNEESWKYPGWGEHIKNMGIVTFFPLLTETCKRSKGSEIWDRDQAKHFGSFQFLKLLKKSHNLSVFKLELKTKSFSEVLEKLLSSGKGPETTSKTCQTNDGGKKGSTKSSNCPKSEKQTCLFIVTEQIWNQTEMMTLLRVWSELSLENKKILS